jgi:hypothetical protein
MKAPDAENYIVEGEEEVWKYDENKFLFCVKSIHYTAAII